MPLRISSLRYPQSCLPWRILIASWNFHLRRLPPQPSPSCPAFLPARRRLSFRLIWPPAMNVWRTSMIRIIAAMPMPSPPARNAGRAIPWSSRCRMTASAPPCATFRYARNAGANMNRPPTGAIMPRPRHAPSAGRNYHCICRTNLSSQTPRLCRRPLRFCVKGALARSKALAAIISAAMR